MALNDTAAVIQRTVDARYTAFKAALDKAISTFGSGMNTDKHREDLLPVASTADNLIEVLAEQDRPPWLQAIRQAAGTFNSSPNRDTTRQLLLTILSHHRDIKPIELLAESLEEYNFDRIFEQLREKHRLPEIFDKLAEELTRIIESGEVDSTVTITAMQKMAAALKANRKGSQSSMEISFDYVRFAWNFTQEVLKKIPGVKEFVTAFEKTIKEGKAEMTALRNDMQEEALAALMASVPNIKKIPNYAAQVAMLTSEEATHDVNGDVEDVEFEVKSGD